MKYHIKKHLIFITMLLYRCTIFYILLSQAERRESYLSHFSYRCDEFLMEKNALSDMNYNKQLKKTGSQLLHYQENFPRH